MNEAISPPGDPVDIRDPVPGGANERPVLAVGDHRAGDRKTSKRDLPALALVVVPAALASDAVAIGALIELVGGLALGGIGAADKGPGGDLDHLRNGYFGSTGDGGGDGSQQRHDGQCARRQMAAARPNSRHARAPLS